ncbi:hypothetical protein ZICARI_187 [Candidatus Zinderia insecticola CARI]|uniref:Uncharacterized protein n=1 Tax=Zinderia insecticola (strain CARI) TaxID=871271 RepID=E0TJ14_ZINIC|nr:hypothetical protein ZICARI_187 [Candidatus Zinderia insecticola CARI]
MILDIKINNFKKLKIKLYKIYFYIYKVIEKSIKINIIFINKSKIKKINFTFKKKKNVTNILTFKNIYNKIIIDSNIYICLKILKKECKNKNIKLKNYFFYIIMHGILHSYNFKHNNFKNYKEMKKKEIYFKNKIKTIKI